MDIGTAYGAMRDDDKFMAAFHDEPRAATSNYPGNISELERWGSLGAGTVLLVAGLTRGKGSGLLLSLLGGALFHRGVTGHCYLYEALGIDTAKHNESTAVPAQQGVKFEKKIAVNRPANELYRFWRNPENLPRIMHYLKEVCVLDDRRSHWIAKGLAGESIEWDAEIFNERENELIAWRSFPGGDLETAGSIHFKPLPAGRGTAVTVSIKCNPPGGKIVAGLASILGVGVEQRISDDLRRFKQMMEAGEIATTEGQPSGRPKSTLRPGTPVRTGECL